MRTILSVFILFFLAGAGSLRAQDQLNFPHGCNYFGEEKEAIHYVFEPSDEAEAIVHRILDAAGALSYDGFVVKASNVENAVAVMVDGQRYILYNTSFLEKFKQDANTAWAAYSVLAHEIGHHLNGHTFDNSNPAQRKKMELEADRFSGAVLRSLGATLEEAKAGIRSLPLPGETATHPSAAAREAAVSNGWKKQDEVLRNNANAEDDAPGRGDLRNVESRLTGAWAEPDSMDVDSMIYQPVIKFEKDGAFGLYNRQFYWSLPDRYTEEQYMSGRWSWDAETALLVLEYRLYSHDFPCHYRITKFENKTLIFEPAPAKNDPKSISQYDPKEVEPEFFDLLRILQGWRYELRRVGGEYGKQ